jgi:uncharacterized membrane protein
MEHEKKLNTIGLIIRLAIIVPTLIFGLMVMASGVNAESSTEDIQALKDSLHFGGVFAISFIALLGCAALVIIFFVILLITRPATAVKSIMGIIIAAVFFFILYGIGSSDTSESLRLGGGIMADQGTIDFAHAGIMTALVAIFVSTVLALGMGFVMKLRKN